MTLTPGSTTCFMLANEDKAGRIAIRPDNAPPWLAALNLKSWPVMSYDERVNEMHVVSLWTGQPKLYAAIIQAGRLAGFDVVFVAPPGHIARWLEQRGLKMKRALRQLVMVEEWRR